MKFQTGDRVLVLHSNEEGEVVDIINEEMVMVEVRGVRFPAYIDQLDFPYFKQFTAKKLFPAKKEKVYVDQVKKEKPSSSQPRKEDGVWLSFLPVMDTDEFGDEVIETLKVHLYNATNTAYNFIYYLNFFGGTEFELKSEVGPFGDFYLHDVPFADMSDSPTFAFEFSLLKPDKKKADYFEATIKLKAKQIFDKVSQMQERGDASFRMKLFDSFPDKEATPDFELPAGKGTRVYSLKDAKNLLPQARSVVDLHIEKLTDSWKGMTSFEILEMQMREFEKWYELSVIHRQPQLIVIHGVGSGRLRDEIHGALRLKKEVKSFVNQFHPSFGYGATEIYLKY